VPAWKVSDGGEVMARAWRRRAGEKGGEVMARAWRREGG